jgi:tetratricopeptide (TPR) repeat protein
MDRAGGDRSERPDRLSVGKGEVRGATTRHELTVTGPEASRPASAPFVGRPRELGRLVAALESAASGRRAVVTVCGDPGIGKSRLVEELGTCAEGRNPLVLVGRCYEASDAPGLWPWRHVLDSYLGQVDRRAVRAELLPHAAPITELFPELRQRLGVVGHAWYLEPARARFRGFDGLVRFLRAASQRRPVAVALEDIHAADVSSLRLLEFVARESVDMRLLLVATYRDGEVEAGGPLAAALAALAESGGEEIRLQALDGANATALVEQTAAGRIPESTVRALVDRGEGNPFFLLELLRNAVDDPRAEGAVPHGIRELVAQRMRNLEASCGRMLAVAAAIGREFDIREIEEVMQTGRRELLDWLGQAAVRRAVAEISNEIGRYRFVHALVREHLYATITAAERPALHRTIGCALEALYAEDIEPHLPEIADHFARGALVGDAGKAFDYAVRAGHGAMRRLAYEEAIRHFQRALSAWRLDEGCDAAARCALLVDLADAHQCAGKPDDARTGYLEAIDLARKLRSRGDAHARPSLARAALGLERTWGSSGIVDSTYIQLLEEALAGLEGDSALRARILARTAVAYYWSNEVERRDDLSREAVEIVRRLGDRESLGHVLYARHFAIWSPARIDEGLAIAEELVALGEQQREGELRQIGRFWRFRDLFELGDIAGARRDIAEYTRIADEIRQPFFQSTGTMAAALFAMIEGRFDEGERLAHGALDLARRGSSPNAEQFFGIQMLTLMRLRGQEGVLCEPVRQFVERLPGIPAWRAALASIYAALGRESDTRRELELIAARNFEDLPVDTNYLVGGAMLAETCAFLGDATRAQALYEMMRPYATRNIAIANCAGYLGVVSHYLGILATVLERSDEADAWFAAALARYEAMNARPFVARALIDRGTAAVRRCADGRLEDQATTIATGLEMARELGMSRLVEKAEAVLGTLGRRAEAESAADLGCQLQHEGEYWTLGHRGVVARLKDAKGLRYLAELVRAPGRDFHVLDLVAAEAPIEPSGAGRDSATKLRLTRGDAGVVLDSHAKSEYRRRIFDLRDALDEAEVAGDIGRAEKARTELAHLTQALAQAVGIGGRDRRAADVAERARLNVTRAIRTAIERIEATHPEVARHLSMRVLTGRFCRYEPRPDDVVRWSF